MRARLGVRDGGPIDLDVVFITESKELLSDELRAVIHDDGVWDSKAMDDVEEEQYGLLRFDHGNRSRVGKQVGVALGCLFEWSNHIKSLDYE